MDRLGTRHRLVRAAVWPEQVFEVVPVFGAVSINVQQGRGRAGVDEDVKRFVARADFLPGAHLFFRQFGFGDNQLFGAELAEEFFVKLREVAKSRRRR